MERTLERLVLSLVLTYLLLKAGHSELIVYPRDTEVLVNHSTYLNCSTSILSEQIHWYHYRVGENRTNYVFYKGQFNQVYSDRYSLAIDTVTGKYNLIIRSVQPGDGGRYECQDDGGLGSKSSAELIVLDTSPICLSSMKPEGLVGPNSCGLSIDELQLSCSVSYSGNIHPILQWKMEGDDAPILKGIASDHSGKRVTMNLTMSSEVEMNRARFICDTTRSRDKQCNCTTGPVKINYVAEQPTILNITKGDTVTCSANATVPCTYRWFYGKDTLHPVLTTTRSEDYICEASCTINGITCTFVAMRIFVFDDETPIASEDTTKTLILAILIPIVAVLLIVACVLFYEIRKTKTANRELTCKVENSLLRKETYATDEVIRLNESTSEDNGVATDPLFVGDTKIIPTCIKVKEIKPSAAKEMVGAIAGVAILVDRIYIVSDNSSEVETFDLETFESKSRCNLKELANPWDLASCKLNRCLYIMDHGSITKPKHVIRVDSDVKALVKWATGKEYGNLSVTRDGNVVVTLCDIRRLFIYRSDGTMIDIVDLSVDVNHVIHPLHALALSNGQFLISYGLGKDDIHRVSIINKNGKLLKNSFEMMKTPSYVAMDENGLVFVADQGNSRVCVLNSDLELIREVASKQNGLRSPQRICVDEKTGKLFVVDIEIVELKQRDGKLLVFKYDLLSE